MMSVKLLFTSLISIIMAVQGGPLVNSYCSGVTMESSPSIFSVLFSAVYKTRSDVNITYLTLTLYHYRH